MKTFNVLTVFSAIIVGINCFEWNDLGALVKDEAMVDISALVAPVVQVKNDIGELAVLTKTKIGKIGFADVGRILVSDGSLGACTNLTNDVTTASEFASNVTQFAVSAVEEITSALSKIVDCTGERLASELDCIMDNIKIVRKDVLDLHTQFQPYWDEAVQLYRTTLSDGKSCLEEW